MTDNNFIINISKNDFELLKIGKTKNNFYVEVDGKHVFSENDIYDIFGEEIGFPDYFGNNWEAFHDIMTDENFITKDIIIVINNSDELFDYREDEKIFLSYLFDLINTKFVNHKIQIFIVS